MRTKPEKNYTNQKNPEKTKKTEKIEKNWKKMKTRLQHIFCVILGPSDPKTEHNITTYCFKSFPGKN